MRLKSIKLTGFKSFVDPTNIPFPTNLTAIVGPNGCGKSNTIDAVRWVLGESSAKNLRGDSMTDVIFNGSTGRKPVGQASVELVFDNSEGMLKGEYAKYNEISVKRKVTRESQNTYYLNGAKCRRKDITDLFLGTGLGPRSYAIIEQGMISKLIEAKPEELRVYLEEAAGISKYKDRRRDTENRMRRTQENLERLTDIREELDRQLSHLHRQAQAAEKYKTYKSEERERKAQLQGLKWLALDHEKQTKHLTIAEQETALEGIIAEQREDDLHIEEQRLKHQGLQDAFQEVQGKYYGLGNEIARFEESINHQAERHQQLQHDLQDVLMSLKDAESHVAEDKLRQEELEAKLLEIEPELEMLAATEEETAQQLMVAEEAMQAWQTSWDEFSQNASEPERKAEVAKSRIQHLEQTIERMLQRMQKLKHEREDLEESTELQEVEVLNEQVAEQTMVLEERQQQLDLHSEEIEQQREKLQDIGNRLNQSRTEMQSLQGRKASLEALQQAAMGESNAAVSEWLEKRQLAKNPRLAESLHVEDGWEKAVETVLGDYLQAVVVDNSERLVQWLDDLSEGHLYAIEKDGNPLFGDQQKGQLLATKVQSDLPLSGFMADVYCVEDLPAALAMRGQLSQQESVVTKEGIWLGKHWLRVTKETDSEAGVIQRQQELETITERVEFLDEEIDELEADFETSNLRLRTLEQARDNEARDLNVQSKQLGELRAQISAREARMTEVMRRREQLTTELSEMEEQHAVESEKMAEARIEWEESIAAMDVGNEAREKLMGEREEVRERVEAARQKARQDKDAAHDLQLQSSTIKNQLSAIKDAMTRLQAQNEKLQDRKIQLEETLAQNDTPLDDLKVQLEEKLAARLEVEAHMTDTKTQLDGVDHELRNFEQHRQNTEKRAMEMRAQLERTRMEAQAIDIRRANLEEQLEEAEFNIEEVVQGLPEEANEKEWEAELERLANRIQRLGAINLAAIDEYKVQGERKEYLDKQNEDLVKAIETLEGAILKIDKETRTRFKETFDKVNAGLKELFPKVFGGGHAYLELTGEDLLDTGIAIMARPPGKKNSTIHLLSGGEKALTAIALVFSIFRLNPAPFCMLDEVDAPLDDANVGRYARLVEAMSEQVQFIYISHNKIAMEMAHQLMGVTMHEPGVSRLVSVNVEEAAEMAQA